MSSEKQLHPLTDEITLTDGMTCWQEEFIAKRVEMAMKKSKILTEEMAKVRSRPQVSVVAASQCAPAFNSPAHRLCPANQASMPARTANSG